MDSENILLFSINAAFELLFRESWNVSLFSQKLSVAQMFLALMIILNAYWATNQDIRMISEGPCDTKDWVMTAESFPITGINCI